MCPLGGITPYRASLHPPTSVTNYFIVFIMVVLAICVACYLGNVSGGRSDFTTKNLRPLTEVQIRDKVESSRTAGEAAVVLSEQFLLQAWGEPERTMCNGKSDPDQVPSTL